MIRPQGQIFRLVLQQQQRDHQNHDIDIRVYPYLDSPAIFIDCWTCGITWELT